MLQAISSVLRAYRSRRLAAAIAAALRPLVDAERDADGTLDEQAWLAPFRSGFLGTVIVRLGRDDDPALTGEALAQVQTGVWTRLTGLPGDVVGERLLALSLAADADFTAGCTAGLAFADAFAMREPGLDTDARAALQLWHHHLAGGPDG